MIHLLVWGILATAMAEDLPTQDLVNLNASTPVRMCYNYMVQRSPRNKEGTVTMSVRFAKTGDVLDAKAIPPKSTLNEPKFLSCLSDALMMMRFSAMTGPDQRTVEAALRFP